jgi:hypothetical protein
MADNKIQFGAAGPSACQCHVPSIRTETRIYSVISQKTRVINQQELLAVLSFKHASGW